jgi:hypothetical protein
MTNCKFDYECLGTHIAASHVCLPMALGLIMAAWSRREKGKGKGTGGGARPGQSRAGPLGQGRMGKGEGGWGAGGKPADTMTLRRHDKYTLCNELGRDKGHCLAYGGASCKPSLTCSDLLN